MREVVDQAIQDGEDFFLPVDAHVDVNAVDDHLASPPLGPLDQFGVALFVRDGLQQGRAEGVAAGAKHLDAHGVGDFTDGGEGTAEVFFGVLDRLADPGDEFYGIEEQFALDMGVFVVLIEVRVVCGHALQDVVCDGYQFPCACIDERQLPLHTQCRLPGWRKINLHVVPSLCCFGRTRFPAAGPPAVGSSLMQPERP